MPRFILTAKEWEKVLLMGYTLRTLSEPGSIIINRPRLIGRLTPEIMYRELIKSIQDRAMWEHCRKQDKSNEGRR